VPTRSATGRPARTDEEREGPAPPTGLAGLSVAALGIVFGDIGTSPVYTFRECFNPEHGLALQPENVLGVLSLIVWALILVVAIKYVLLIMRADNQGEGQSARAWPRLLADRRAFWVRPDPERAAGARARRNPKDCPRSRQNFFLCGPSQRQVDTAAWDGPMARASLCIFHPDSYAADRILPHPARPGHRAWRRSRDLRRRRARLVCAGRAEQDAFRQGHAASVTRL
jgi:hypothetical protein